MVKMAAFLVTAAPAGATGEGSAFLKVDARECLLRSADLFVNRDDVVQALACFETAHDERGREKFGGHLAFSGVKLASAANGWHGQIASMAEKVGSDATHVLVHDAARPAVAYTDVDAVVEAATHSPADVIALCVEPGEVVLDVTKECYRPGAGLRALLWPRLYPIADLSALSLGSEPPPGRLRLLPSSRLNVRCSVSEDAKLVAAMLRLLPERKREGPLNPFDEARW